MHNRIKRGQGKGGVGPKHRPGVRRAAFQLEMTTNG